ncbi:acyltransferase [Bradyrhizobium sp. LHD-71]|uniref:acyltransferase family protein n=1 Tax=Bradyrhizobium sp. LHD-71 TaxID=3072141 RepID=UPI00280D6E92|nr:acyltransferase [Bradyrhizobium sp. LHD-71]MDQ8726273.1 acyltransferase [Bradyrhizobium sp. LHD-71]
MRNELNRKRLVTISVVQFFASVCIMVRHYSYFLEPYFPDVATVLGRVTFSDYFFCCSGFLLHYVNLNKDSVAAGPLVKKRFWKLYPLHFATCLFYIAIIVMTERMGGLGGTRSTWECVIPTVTLTHALGTLDQRCMNYPSWFLSALFVMYIAYAPLHFLVRKAGAWTLAVIIIAAVLIYEVAYRLAGLPHWTTLTYDLGVLRGIPTFLAGMLIAECLPAIRDRVTSFLPAYVVFVASLAGMMIGMDPLIPYAVLQVGLVALLAGAELNNANSFLRNPTLTPVGAWSFPLYLLHVPVAAVVMNFLFVRILHVQGGMVVVAMLVTGLVAVTASYVVHKLQDDWGPKWWTTRRFGSASSSP